MLYVALAFWLLVGGIGASLLKGLDFEEATILGLVLIVLTLGRRAFYRPTSILEERFTPIWAVSIVGVIADIHQAPLGQADEAVIYHTLRQFPYRPMTLVARGT